MVLYSFQLVQGLKKDDPICVNNHSFPRIHASRLGVAESQLGCTSPKVDVELKRRWQMVVLIWFPGNET